MNNNRRKQIKEILERVEKAYNDLEALAEEEREAFENLPEGIQDSERGQTIEGYADAIEYAYGDLETVKDQLTAILEGSI